MRIEIILGVIAGIIRYLGLGLVAIGLATWGIARLCRSLGVWGVIIPAVFAFVAIIILVIGVVVKHAGGA